jgi:hypothetical protein
MKFHHLFIVAFTAAAMALLALYAHGLFAAQSLAPEGPEQPASIAQLSGFGPNAEVTYKVITPGQNAITGHAQTGEDGTLDIPAQGMCQDTDTSLTYDFSIREEGSDDPVNLTVKMETSTGEMSLSGEGFEKFGPVSLQSGENDVPGRADWAGIYRHKGMWDLDQQAVNNFQFVFFGKVPGELMSTPDPRIIKIFTAPGGGSFSGRSTIAGQGINAYRNLWCETTRSGRVVPSTCRAPQMGPLIWNGTCPTDHMAVAGINIINHWVRAMKMMTHQLYAAISHQIFIIGPFVDAKIQLETQREIQRLTAEAHKDYMPSDTMCRFGSFMKSIPDTEERVGFNKLAMNNMLMANYTNRKNSVGAGGFDDDIKSRLQQYRRTYCDTRDNRDGLAFLCDHDGNYAAGTRGAAVPGGIGAVNVVRPGPLPPGPVPPPITSYRMNKDIDFPRTMNYPYTLNVDFTDDNLTYDEEDVLALGRSLYWPIVLQPAKERNIVNDQELYMDVRSIGAFQNIAHNSYIEIAAMKSRAATLPPPGPATTPPQDISGWNFMKSMMREFGMTDMDIHELLGEYPSYYAQMEVLTKKMYENPDFYTNLYDTPVNLDRIYATMDTIRIMQQRDQFESKLRQEMITSLMLEEVLRARHDVVNDTLVTKVRSRF